MSIMNRIIGALRGAASGGGRPARGGPVHGGTPGGARGGVPRSGRGLLRSLLNGRGRRPGT